MFAVLGWTAAAVGSEGPRVNVFDDCDAATFNAAVGRGLRWNGKTTFQDFVAQLQANGVIDNKSGKGWKFAPGHARARRRTAVHRGQQGRRDPHVISEVQNFTACWVASRS
jgi:hypothetical protein